MLEINTYLMEQFDKGGPLMWPLLAASVVSLTFILERAWTLIRVPGNRKAASQAEVLLQEVGRVEEPELLEHLGKTRGLLGHVYASVVQKHLALKAERVPAGAHWDELEREADQATREYLAHYLPVLATVGSVAPLLGLLGTITGMIKAFSAISVSGVGDPGHVAAGVSEALITTATGLMVAIPTIILHRYLAVVAVAEMRRLEMFTRSMGYRLLEGNNGEARSTG